MKKLIILILISFVIIISGCAEKAQENSTNPPLKNTSTNNHNIRNNSIVVDATKLQQINTSLQKGPVLLEIWEEGCDDCQAMKPILAKVAADYGSKCTIMSISMDKSPKLADYFGAYVVPVLFVILDNKSGNYTYLMEDGNVSTDEFKAKIIGPRNKETLEKILDTAMQQRYMNQKILKKQNSLSNNS